MDRDFSTFRVDEIAAGAEVEEGAGQRTGWKNENAKKKLLERKVGKVKVNAGLRRCLIRFSANLDGVWSAMA